MIKRIISLMVIVIMAFAFTACDGGNALKLYKTGAKDELVKYAREKGEDNYTGQNWTILQGFVEDGKAEIDKAIDNKGVDTALAEAKEAIDEVPTKEQELALYKNNAKAALESYAEEKGEDNYSAKNWAILQGFANDGNAAIDVAANYDEVDVEFDAANEKIDAIERRETVVGDFVVKIWAENSTLLQGEAFKIFTEITNISGRVFDVPGLVFSTPEIPGWIPPVVSEQPPPGDYTIHYEKDETHKFMRELGGNLKVGEHYLRYDISFWINYASFWVNPQADEYVRRIYSNTIKLTVL